MNEGEKLCRAADAQLKEAEASGEVSRKWLDQFAVLVKNNILLQQKVTDLEHFAEKMGEATQEAALRIQKVEVDQVLLDWKVRKLLSALDPEGYPDPGPEPGGVTPEEPHPPVQN